MEESFISFGTEGRQTSEEVKEEGKTSEAQTEFLDDFELIESDF
jgi:hypothetical protein